MRTRRGLLVLLVVSLLLGLGSTAVLADDGQEPLPVVDAWRAWVRFNGVVARRPADDTVGAWVVGGRSVQVTENTVFDETRGPAVVGAEVWVIAQRVAITEVEDSRLVPRAPAARLEAILIRVLKPADVSGRVAIRGWVMDLQPTSLVVNGLKILYDRSTHISGELRVGALVKVVAVQTAAGLKALSIEVLPPSRRVIYFQGTIQTISHSLWVVGGRRVGIGPYTVIVGRPAIGLQARVWALTTVSSRPAVLPNREVLAILIQVVEEPVIVEWTGRIDRLPANITIWPPVYTGQWVVGGRPVWVNSETEIVGTPRIGLQAHVVAYRSALHPLVAKKIEILSVTPLTGAQ